MSEIQATSTNEVLAEDNIYETPMVPVTENEKKLLQVDVGAAAVSRGADLEEVLSPTVEQNPSQIKQGLVQEGVERAEGLVVDAVELTATTTPDQLENILGVSSEALRAIREQSESEMAPFIAWAEGIEGSEKLGRDVIREIAANKMLLDVFARKMDEQSKLGYIGDILGAMAVPDYSYNSAGVFSELTGGDIDLIGFLSSVDSIEAIGRARESLMPVDRVAFDKMLVKALEGVDDNVLQQFDIALSVIGQNPESLVDQQIEKADIAIALTPIIGQIAHGLKVAARGSNIMKHVGQLGDKVTSQVVSRSSSDGEMAAKVGVNPMDAASLGNPVADKSIFNGAPDGVQALYRTIEEDVEESLSFAEDVMNITAVPNSVERAKLVDSIKKNLSRREDIENLQFEETATGIEVRFNQLNKDNTVSEVVQTHPYTVDSFGGFVRAEGATGSTAARWFTSPNFAAKEDRKLFVEKAQAGSFAAGKLGKQFGDAIDSALKPVRNNKKSLSKIDYVLQELDGTNTALSYNQLVKVGVGGVKLTDKEFVSALGIRKTLDRLWETNNDVLRREMELSGVKGVSVSGANDFGRVFDTPESVSKANIKIEAQAVDVDGGAVELTSEVIEDGYRSGKVLVKNTDPNEVNWYKADGDNLVQFAWVSRENISALPHQVLNRVPNYLPKIQKDGNWFLKTHREVTVNGKPTKLPVTEAYGATKTQLERYLAKRTALAKDTAEPVSLGDFEIVFDRQTPDKLLGSNNATISGGLIRGARKSEGLRYAGDVVDEKRVDAFEAMQRYIGITADKAALSEWRVEARQRWLNQAASYPGMRDKILESSWEGAADLVKRSNIPTKQKSKLLTLHGQVSVMSRIPSQSDRALQEFIKDLAVRVEKGGKVGENVAKYMYRVHDQSPTELAKSAVFHTTLGLFNLAQLPVQMFGATVALSLEPLHAPRAMFKWMASSALDIGSNTKSVNGLAKKLGMDIEDYNFWRKSGMREGVVRGNADLGSINSNLPYDAGLIRRGYHSLLNAGQTPYRMGELANMRISFFTALERQKALDGKNFVYNDATLSKVISKAEQYRLNMGSANKAAFQKGLWGLPTQFKQIYTKYVEALTGDFLSKGERAKLIVGQVALYGAVGVPFLNHWSDQLASKLLPEGSDEDTVRGFKHGAMGLIVNGMMDTDAAFSGRLTVSSDLVEEFLRLATDERSTVLQVAAGASFTTGDKVVDLVENLAKAGTVLLGDEEADDPAIQAATLDVILKSAAKITSAGRSWVAAEAVTKGLVLRADGTPLISVDPTVANTVARAMGFSSLKAEELFKISRRNLETEQDRRDMARFYAGLFLELHDNVDSQNDLGTKATHNAITLMKEHIYSQYPEDAREIMRKVDFILKDSTDFEGKTIRTAIENSLSEFSSSANMMMSTVMKETGGME